MCIELESSNPKPSTKSEGSVCDLSYLERDADVAYLSCNAQQLVGKRSPMNAILKKMSRLEKLRTMEALWSDLTRDEGKYASPSWHFEVLEQTEREIRAGRAKFVDWESAKKSIRRRAR